MLRFFGKGGAFDNETNSSAYYHNDESKSIVILDCGENTFEKISKYIAKHNITDVNILITHLHSDHVGCLSTLIYWMHFIRGRIAKIYIPTDIFGEVQTILKIAGNNDGYELIGVRSQEVKAIGDIAFSPILTEHVDNIDSFGYLISNGEKKIYYSGDSKSLPKEIVEIKDSIDLFYQDISLYDFKDNPHMSYDRFIMEYPIDVIDSVVPYHHSSEHNQEIVAKINDFLLNGAYLNIESIFDL